MQTLAPLSHAALASFIRKAAEEAHMDLPMLANRAKIQFAEFELAMKRVRPFTTRQIGRISCILNRDFMSVYAQYIYGLAMEEFHTAKREPAKSPPMSQPERRELRQIIEQIVRENPIASVPALVNQVSLATHLPEAVCRTEIELIRGTMLIGEYAND